MDGYTLTYQLRQLLSESSGGTWIDTVTSYDFLYQAAIMTAHRTGTPTSTQAITTAASTSTYALNADFLKLYLQDDSGQYFLKYYDGTSYYWIYWRDYAAIVLANQTTAVTIPHVFTIRDKAAVSADTGTATSDGDETNNESTLTDTAATFVASNISAGDWIHNTIDGSHGVVLSVTDATHLVCALHGGTDNEWDTNDAYTITLQPRLELVFDPAPSTVSHTATVYYVQKPTPVYSLYRSYNFNPSLTPALVNYAAWLYKYRDQQPNYGDVFYRAWDMATRNMNNMINDSRNRKGYRVSFIKSASRTGTTR